MVSLKLESDMPATVKMNLDNLEETLYSVCVDYLHTIIFII